MAVGNYTFNHNIPEGGKLANALATLENGYYQVVEVGGAMNQQLDGGVVTQPFADLYGFPDVATAQAAYNEFQAMLGNVNNASAAMIQAFNKFR